MSINIDNNVKNQGQAPAMLTGLDANKPNAGQPGRLFYATDTNIIYIDNGTTWDIFIESSSGPSITVNPNYLPKADPSGNLVNSALYENVTTGDIVWGDTDTQWGNLSLSKDANRVIMAFVNKSTSGDDKTSDFRFVGYGGAVIELLANVYATNANQVNTNSFPNSLNIKAKKANGKIVFIVGGDTSANIKGFVDNNGYFVIGSLAINDSFCKLQVTGGIGTDNIQFKAGGFFGESYLQNNGLRLWDTSGDYSYMQPLGVSFTNDSSGNSGNYNYNQFNLGDNNTGKSISGNPNYFLLNDDGLIASNYQNASGVFLNANDSIYQSSITPTYLLINNNDNNNSVNIGNIAINGTYLGSPVYLINQNAGYFKALDLGTYSNTPMVSIGFSLAMGSKNNRGTITYTGGILNNNTSVVCNINFMGSYPSTPFGYVSESTLISGINIQLTVNAMTSSVMTVTIHNISGGSIASGTIKFNYLVIL